MSIFFNYNGKLYKEGSSVIRADNRAFRYGDGLFETMKVIKGRIIRSSLHFERLFNSLLILRYPSISLLTPQFIKDEVMQLVSANKHLDRSRVRFTIFRGEGNLYPDESPVPGYLIQSWPLEPNAGDWNERGVVTGIYPDARKPCDKFSQLKTNNFLLYVMAAGYAQDNKWNDAIVLNTSGRICDSTIANVFISKGNELFTPPLSEGCIAGTFRKFLLKELPGMGIRIHEQALTPADLEEADEIFLTNAIYGIRWVKEFQGKEYGFEEAFRIFSLLDPTSY